MPEFEEDRYFCGVTTNDKIQPSTLPPIHINDTRVGMLSLEVFSFRIITHTYGILDEYLSIPSDSEFVIILDYLFNKCTALIGVNPHQRFFDSPLEDINILLKNNHQTFLSLVGDSRDNKNKNKRCPRARDVCIPAATLTCGDESVGVRCLGQSASILTPK